MNKPKIKSFKLTTSSTGVSVHFENTNDSLVFPINRLPLFNLLGGEYTIKEIWHKLQESNSPIKLSEIYLTIERLKKNGAMEGVVEKNDFEVNWLDYSILKFEFTKNKSAPIKSKSGFLIFTVATLLFSMISLYFIYSDLTVHSFLQKDNSFLYSIPTLIFLFSYLGIFKGIIKAVSIALATGEWPQLFLCYRGLMFDLEVNESKILVEENLTKRLYQLTKAFCFLFIGVATSSFIDTDLARQIQIVALLMTFVWLNPYRKSEFTQVLSSFFDDEEIRYLKPFLKKKSLTSFISLKKSNHSENKLVIFSSLSLLWTFLFIGFAQDFIIANAGFWFEAYNSGSLVEKLSAIFITVSFVLLNAVLMYDLIHILFLNFINLFAKKIKIFLSQQLKSSSDHYNREELESLFKDIPFFNDISVNDLKLLASKVSLKKYSVGQNIIIDGEVGNEMFILLSGEAEVQKENESGFIHKFAKLGRGAVFGEMALLEKINRTADVVALSDVIVAVLSEDQFNQIWGTQSDKIKAQLRLKISFTRFLSSSSVFKNLPSETIQLFLKNGLFEKKSQGEKIVTQGSLDQSFYLLLEGHVHVQQNDKTVAKLGQGDFFGEMSLFNNKPRVADVISDSSCLLLKLEKDSFWEVVTENMELALNLETISDLRGGGAIC